MAHKAARAIDFDYLPPEPYVDYAENDRAAQRYNFHWDDVPDEVIAAPSSRLRPSDRGTRGDRRVASARAAR